MNQKQAQRVLAEDRLARKKLAAFEQITKLVEEEEHGLDGVRGFRRRVCEIVRTAKGKS